MELCGGGTHPFSRRLGTVTPLSRYQAMAARTGILGQLKVTFALHVHVGVGSARDALVAMQGVRACLPLLVALSASSPFWFGYDSGHASWRQRILASDRTYGIPPHFRRWRDVEGFFDTAHRAGILSSWRDIHWDLRPRPDFGTVEIRVMDAPPTLSESTAIAAFARALTVYLLRTPASQRPPLLPRVLPRWLEIENHFQAARLALDAEYVDASGAVRPLRDILDATLEAISATGDELGDGDYLAQLHPRVTRDPSHARQRRVYRETGSTRAVVADLAHQFSVDLDRAPHRPVYSISSTRTSPSSVSTMPMPGQ
jgi:carboxylate-amine ligase